MRIYGDSTVSNLKKLETYPEIKDIRNAIYRYCEHTEKIEKGYTIINSFVNIFNTSNTNTIMSNFTVELTDGTQRQILGKLIKSKNEYQFIPFNEPLE